MKNAIYIFLFFCVFCIACSGQNEKTTKKEVLGETPHFYGVKPDHSAQVSQYIRQMLQDKQGNIWFGTNDDGVALFDGKSLVYFTMKEGFSGTAVRGIFEDKEGNIWFGTNCGVSKYISSALHRAGEKPFINFTINEGLIDNNVWSLYGDKAGNIWVGTEKGISIYNPSAVQRPNEKPFRSFILPTSSIEKPKSVFSPKLVWSFLEDNAGNMWFGTDGLGAYKYTTSTKTFTNFTSKEGLCDNVVDCMMEDSKGNLWLGTRFGGLSRFDGKTFTNFSTKDGLSSNFIVDMKEDKTGFLWFSALGGGICRYNPTVSEKPFTNYNVQNGLTNLYVQSILEDKSGKLWFGSGAGLFRFEGNMFSNVLKANLVK